MSYLRDVNGLKITTRLIAKEGREVSQKWLLNASQTDLDFFEVTIHQDPIKPAFDADTQYLQLQSDGEYAVVDYTAQEITDRDLEADVSNITSKGKDMALVLVELVQWQLANTAMIADDFSPEVKQAYLDIKDIADRITQ